MNAFEHKWWRRSILNVFNKYGGVSDAELKAERQTQNITKRLEAVGGIALELEQRLLDLMDGLESDLGLDPVTKFHRIDGISMKNRELTNEEPMHQCYDHLAVLGLEPLLKAKILPWQYASIPGKGQVAGARKIKRWLVSKASGTKYVDKIDVHAAYLTTQGQAVLALLHEDIPRAVWQLALVAALLAMDPDGALLIGSYLSAWLFNYVMSKFLRHVLSLAKCRRGQAKHLISCLLSYMDDVANFSARLADLRMAIKLAGKWLTSTLGLELKSEVIHVEFLGIKKERARRNATRPAARGCPGLDMMGYVVHCTYITIRPRIFKRARRQYLRAASDIKRLGYLPTWRANKLICYYGPFKNSNSRKAQKNLNVQELFKTAKARISYAARVRKIKGAKAL